MSLYSDVKYRIEFMDGCDINHDLACIQLVLSGDTMIKFIDKFIGMDHDDVDDECLDMIRSIVIYAKTIYESDRYCDAYPDNLYDSMLSKFKKFKAEPFSNNATGIANATYKYDELSGTLDKTHFIYESDKGDDVRDSLEEYFEDLPIDDDDVISVFVNQKKDGASITIDYRFDGENYIPDSAVSRGNRDYGEGTDVSQLIPNCTFTGKHIYDCLGYCPKYIGVQHEALISHERLSLLEKYCSHKFANNRNAIAGLMRRSMFAPEEESIQLKSFMSLVPVGFDILDKYIEDMKEYNKPPWNQIYVAITKSFIYGDITMSYKLIHGTKSEVLKQFKVLADDEYKERGKINHAIDGLVITILDKDLQKKLGRKNGINKWQVAYKFPEEGKKTIVRDLIVTTGNFGYKELILKVDPVILNGTNQFKAQLHSLKRFKKMNLRIGDEIILKLSGDVIPYGYKDNTCHEGDGKRIKLPTHCDCGAELVEENNKLRCPNVTCSHRIVGSMVTFFNELNAKGIGEKTCEQLHSELGVDNVVDLLKLNADDFKSLGGFKDASAKLCMNTINDVIRRPRSIASILSALGIDSFRTSTANKLLETVDMAKIIELAESDNRDELVDLIKKSEGINENAKVIAKGLINNIDVIKQLMSMMTIKKKDNYVLDKVLVISGLRNDTELTDIANKNGYKVKDNGKKFDLLVIKDESLLDKSKSVYAISKGVPIMTRDEFVSKYGV